MVVLVVAGAGSPTILPLTVSTAGQPKAASAIGQFMSQA
jgi:hypothetical protein